MNTMFSAELCRVLRIIFLLILKIRDVSEKTRNERARNLINICNYKCIEYSILTKISQ